MGPTPTPGLATALAQMSIAGAIPNPVPGAHNDEAASPATLDAVPIPAKLRSRILQLDYVEMHELLPEAWGAESNQSCCPGSRRHTRRAPVQDILLWTECFGSLVAILGSAYPQHVADFMAYQRSIVRASRIFEGNAWVVYDRCYRRRAALTKDLNWSKQHTDLYNEAFTGRARSIPRCGHCLSENHSVADCPDSPQGVTPPSAQPPRQANPRTFSSPQQTRPAPPAASGTSAEYCRLFNQIRCRSRRCRYLHLCSGCSLPHPEQVCPDRGRRDRSPRPLPPSTREGPWRPPPMA